MSTVPANQRGYSIVVAMECLPETTLPQYRSIIERLSCGHLGRNHGGTWDGTDAPLRHHPEDYQGVIGKKRQCHTCSTAATQQSWEGGAV